MATRRRSVPLAGCGLLVLLGAGLMMVGSLGATMDGQGDIGPLLGTAACFGAFALLGLGAVVYGLASKAIDPQQAMAAAAAQARNDGSAPVDLGAGASAATARDAFRGAIGVTPTANDVTFDRAVDLLSARRYDAALAAFQAIAAAEPMRREGALSNAGVCLHMLGRYEEAIATYEEALAAGAHPRTIAENIVESREAITRRR